MTRPCIREHVHDRHKHWGVSGRPYWCEGRTVPAFAGPRLSSAIDRREGDACLPTS